MFPYLDAIQQVATPIVIVFCISKVGSVYRYFFTSKPKTQLKKPYTRYDQFADLALLLSGLIYIVVAFLPRPNFFAQIGAETDSLSFHIRRQCNTYLVQKYPNSQTHKDTEILTFEKMCDLMVGTSYKNIYLMFGDSLSECAWCRSELDFLYYTIPKVISSYIPFLFLVGICTMNWRRQAFRLWYGLGVLVTLIMEIGVLSTEEPIHHLYPGETQYNAIAIYRNFSLGFSLIFLYFLTSKEWTDKELLASMVETTNHIRYRNQATDSINTVTLRDQNLKKKYLDFHEEVKKAKKNFHHQPAVKVF
jgi:hypothetical protein